MAFPTQQVPRRLAFPSRTSASEQKLSHTRNTVVLRPCMMLWLKCTNQEYKTGPAIEHDSLFPPNILPQIKVAFLSFGSRHFFALRTLEMKPDGSETTSSESECLQHKCLFDQVNLLGLGPARPIRMPAFVPRSCTAIVLLLAFIL